MLSPAKRRAAVAHVREVLGRWRVSERRACRNHVWSYDFMADRTRDGRALKLLTIIDEYSRECLAIDVGRHLTS